MPNQETEKTITLSNITKKYPLIRPEDKKKSSTFRDFAAVSNVSAEIRKGSILGIIGRNGAGKTTLLNIIGGILSPTEGEVVTNGKILGLFNLGVGFQDELTGKENIFLNGSILGASKKELNSKLPDIIKFSELGNFITMPLGSYSQGMRLRLGFSIIANLDFEILLIDEVLAVGDTLFQNKCFERLTSFKQAGKTLIITTQDMNMIDRMCDTVLLLDHGKLLFEGIPSEAVNRYQALLSKEKFYVGPSPDNQELIENTKRWADPKDLHGKKLGTKEAVIDSVRFYNKFGLPCSKIKSNDALKIKVVFDVIEEIEDPHFGIAIFREDGVYCYGPNTRLDNHIFPKVPEGKSSFTLKYPNIQLAPGQYTVSVAIWDKKETVPYDYHNSYYDLTVTGEQNESMELLNIPAKITSGIPEKKVTPFPPSSLSEKWGTKISSDNTTIESVEFINDLGERNETLTTGNYARLNIQLNSLPERKDNLLLWVGIYRNDETYCQGFQCNVDPTVTIEFDQFPLLPGGYCISVGLWEKSEKKFLTCHHGVYPFKMVFDRKDHGTVLLEHKWSWKLPT